MESRPEVTVTAARGDMVVSPDPSIEPSSNITLIADVDLIAFFKEAGIRTNKMQKRTKDDILRFKYRLDELQALWREVKQDPKILNPPGCFITLVASGDRAQAGDREFLPEPTVYDPF